jgi:DNA adenine methylase
MPDHEWYGEVFLGSGVLLLNKPRSEEEFGNDLFAEIVSFWNTLRSASKTKKLFNLMQWTLDSRQEYQDYMRVNPEELNMVDRAYRFLYLIKFGFNSYMNTYYSPASHKIGKIKDFMMVWENTAKQLYKYHDRVRKVHFSNYDFRDFLKKIKPHSRKFLFLDPPYIDTHSYDEYYEEGKFDEHLYEDMRDLLAEHHKGGTMWQITCHQKNTYFDEMDDIIIKLIDRKACMNNNEERADVKTKIVMNYDIRETGSILDKLDNKDPEGEFLDV